MNFVTQLLLKDIEPIRFNIERCTQKKVYYNIDSDTFLMYYQVTNELIFIIGIDGSVYGDVGLVSPTERDTIIETLKQVKKSK